MSEQSTLSPHSILVFALGLALGVYVILFARKFFARPDEYIRQWMPQLPQRPWALQLVRSLACFCLWGGNMIIGSAIISLMSLPRGPGLLLADFALASLATCFLLPKNASSVQALMRLKQN